MGNTIRINHIINLVIEQLQDTLEVDAPDKYQNIVDKVDYKIKLEKKNVRKELQEVIEKQKDQLIKKEVKEYFRNYIRSDFDFLKKIMSLDTIFSYSDDEIKELLLILYRVRKYNPNVFYRTSIGDAPANKSIDANIRTGKLDYKYEEFCNAILSEYLLSSELTITTKEDYIAANIQVKKLEAIKRNLINDYFHDKDVGIYIEWREFICRLEQIQDDIQTYNKAYENNIRNVLCGIYYMDVICGAVRDVLIAHSFFTETVKDDLLGNYVDLMCETIENNSKLYDGKYELIFNYLLHIVILGMLGERKYWLKVYTFLLSNEPVDDERLNRTRTLIQKKKCKIIMEWFKKRSTLSYNEEDLFEAIYYECFIDNDIPAWVNKKGIHSFVNYIESEKIDYSLNMNQQEYFIFEKIFRGLYRRWNMNDIYYMKIKNLRQLYEMEITVMESIDKSKEFMTIWIKSIIECLRKLISNLD